MNRNFALPSRRVIFIGITLLLLAACSSAFAGRSGHGFSDVTGQPHMQTAVPTGRVVIRLAPESGLKAGAVGIEVRDSRKSSTAAAEALRVTGLVRSLAAGAVIESRFPGFGEKSRPAPGAPDLSLYAHFDARTLDRSNLIKIVATLNADPAISLAYLEPVAVPAALGFDAVTGAFDPPLLPSDDFEYLQGYLGDAPDGVGALSMRAQPGALGTGVAVIDVEGGWLWTHEDLPTPVAEIGDQLNDLGWRNHGTAVVGVIRGEDNGYGVTGIAPACDIGHSSIGTQYTAQAILSAAAVLAPGDIIVIELHAPGPEATGSGQQGFVPMEFWQDIFDAIQVVTAQGIIVCEAAGNGAVDLDNPLYQGLFDRSQRDSGAIMCGATSGSSLTPAGFSNNGTRVDLNGWGYNVTTLGYGGLQGDPEFPEEQWYTGTFNGTSSATPVVTGAVVGLQGMVRAEHGLDLNARLARDILLATGTPASGPQLIGARPNLVAAWAVAELGIGEVTGTVTDATTLLPVEGVLVQVTGDGAWTRTAADGTWTLPLLTGAVDFEFSEFHYQTQIAGAVVTSGATSVLDVALNTVALIDISGTVYGADPVPVALSGADVTPLDHPVSAASSDGGGAYELSGVPGNKTYRLRFDGVPGYGAQVYEVPVQTSNALLSPGLDPIVEDFEGSDGGFAGVGSLWTRGTPPAAVVGAAFSGTECWGIGMDGFGYGDDQADTLSSPVYDLSTVSGSHYFLSFHLWSATEVGFDGVHVIAEVDGVPTVLQPLDDYSDLFLGGLGQQSGWSGNTGRWQGTVFDVSAFIGGDFQFHLVFGSDAGVTDYGFFVDGIAFGTGPKATPAPDDLQPLAAASSLKAWPNPFNPRVNIAWSIPTPGDLQIDVFDLRGRRVQTLQRGVVSVREGRVSWDGRDAGGRRAASGVYLVQLRGPNGSLAAQRVVLAK